MVLALWSIADGRIHHFLAIMGSHESCNMCLIGKSEKMEFDWVWAVYHTIVAQNSLLKGVLLGSTH